MRKLLLFLLIPVLFIACKKDETQKCTYTSPNVVAPPGEIDSLQRWLAANSIDAVQHSSGIFYKITEDGSGATPDVCNTIFVKYSGTFLSGGLFDANIYGTTFLLGQLVTGWQIGLPLIKAGGSITLYVPPSLAYGNRDIRDENNSIRIPANSYLIFKIQLVQVN